MTKKEQRLYDALSEIMPFVMEDYNPHYATPDFKQAVENANLILSEGIDPENANTKFNFGVVGFIYHDGERFTVLDMDQSLRFKEVAPPDSQHTATVQAHIILERILNGEESIDKIKKEWSKQHHENTRKRADI